MSINSEPKFRGPMLGIYSQRQAETVIYFMQNHQASAEKLNFETEVQRLFLQRDLRDLTLKGALAEGDKDPVSLLNRPQGEIWENLIEEANRALGRSVLKQRGLIPDNAEFVSGEEVSSVLAVGRRGYFLSKSGFEIYWSDKPSANAQARRYAIPNDYIITPDILPGTMRVIGVCDYELDLPKEDRTQKTEAIRDTFKSKHGRQALRLALSECLQIPKGSIDMPSDPAKLPPIRCVIGGQNPNSDLANLSGYDEQIVFTDIPDVNAFTRFYLRFITGKIPPMSDWRNYFQETKEEETIPEPRKLRTV